MRLECKETGEIVEVAIEDTTIVRDADDTVHISVIRNGQRYEVSVPLVDLVEAVARIERGDPTPLHSQGKLDIQRVQ